VKRSRLITGYGFCDTILNQGDVLSRITEWWSEWQKKLNSSNHPASKKLL